jgi:hypothetical protein
MLVSTARRLPAVLLALGLCLLPACSKKHRELAPEFGPPVRGKVTYKGEPVVYGMVLFFTLGKGLNPETGEMAPSASAKINSDGTYEITNAPLGPAMVCVATDPDADLMTLLAPVPFGGGAPTVAEDAPKIGPLKEGEAPPKFEGPPVPQGRPVPGKKIGGGPRLPPGVPPPPNPLVENLTDAQKKTLKAIHEKFGKPGVSNLHFVVHKGEAELTYNIELE